MTAGIDGWHGQAALLRKGGSACYRCVLGGSSSVRSEEVPQPTPGAFVGVVGAFAASIALRALDGIEGTLTGQVTLLDGTSGATQLLRAPPNTDCRFCRPTHIGAQAGRHVPATKEKRKQ